MNKGLVGLAIIIAAAGVMAFSAPAFAAPVTYTNPTNISITSPAVTLVVASGSVADSVVVNATSVLVSMSATTGGTFTLTSAASDLSLSASAGGGTDPTSCTGGVASTTISQGSGSATYTITPTGSPCGGGGGGGGGGGSGGGGSPQADLGVKISVDNQAPQAGSIIHYTITAFDLGPAGATDVMAQDTLPSGLKLISAAPSVGTFNATSGVWNIGTLSPHVNATLILTVQITGTVGVNIVDSVVISSQSGQTFDINSTNNLASQSIFISAGTSVASSGSGSESSSTSSLQATIYALQAQLQALLAQAAAGSGTAGGGTTAIFTRNLKLYDRGTDVMALQQYLIAKHVGLAAKALAAHGVTKTFGILTYRALREFQASVGLSATGYFGPLTRAYVNQH